MKKRLSRHFSFKLNVILNCTRNLKQVKSKYIRYSLQAQTIGYRTKRALTTAANSIRRQTSSSNSHLTSPMKHRPHSAWYVLRPTAEQIAPVALKGQTRGSAYSGGAHSRRRLASLAFNYQSRMTIRPSSVKRHQHRSDLGLCMFITIADRLWGSLGRT